MKIYEYISSIGESLYVRNGVVELVAFENTEYIERGMAAAGAEVISVGHSIPAIEKGLDVSKLTDDILVVIAERIVSEIANKSL